MGAKMFEAGRILPVILAGGGGTRLWPVSTDRSPKQFQKLTGPLSTYQMTLRRVEDPAMFASPVVITAESFQAMAADAAAEIGLLPEIVVEPLRRDSAAAIAVAAVMAENRQPGGLVLALAADHIVGDTELFLESVRHGCLAAEAGDIVVFAIKPTAPLTSYGYIDAGDSLFGHTDVCRVRAFVEKPDALTARAHVKAGYLWNSGNFLFRSDVMITQFEIHAPEILAAARTAIGRGSKRDGVLVLDKEAFATATATSIDYAVIDKTRAIAVVKGRFAWSDIGSWDAISDMLAKDEAGNAIFGNGYALDSRNCLIHSGHGLTAVVGVEDLAVISTAGAVLVIPKNRSQEVKALVEKLRALAAFAAGGTS
jgi:mannose-1-phosphate guanylyltransferase/mannose-6-phosphate isomerase